MKIIDVDDINVIKFDGRNYLLFRVFYDNHTLDYDNCKGILFCSDFIYTYFNSVSDYVEKFGDFSYDIETEGSCCGYTTFYNNKFGFNKEVDNAMMVEYPYKIVATQMDPDKYFDFINYIKDGIISGQIFRRLMNNNFFNNIYSIISHDKIYFFKEDNVINHYIHHKSMKYGS